MRVPDEVDFCGNCGQSLSFARMRAAPAQGEGGRGGPPSAEEAKNRVLEACAAREKTDKPMSSWWAAIVVFYIASYSGIFLAFAFILLDDWWHHLDRIELFQLLYSIILPVLLSLFGVFIGLLILTALSRINGHIEREERLRSSLMWFVRASAAEHGGEYQILNEIIALSAFDGQSLTYEKKLNPKSWGWRIGALFVFGGLGSAVAYLPSLLDSSDWWPFLAILTISVGLGSSLASFIAILLLFYIAWVVMKTLYTHDIRWMNFSTFAVTALHRLGYRIEPPNPQHALRERSFALYLVATIMSLGLFGVYWIHALVRDLNDHFRYQRWFESALADILRH